MRLKSLEIKGFKSFATETVIHFDDDVIGIVGPNGSGKSNIVDAIRWVLGEQKGKELRLDSMGDVIFNGTKKRKAGGVAHVSITFDNTRNILPTEYQSVTITRMLYRSGESEYRLNGVTCRLKDIRTLLMDSGIGSNSYAIIALGMVDDILHNKENARRRMFEQAAGIAKYKRRKHETILKLKSTSADLERVEDLLYEIEGNLKMLEKQARRTKRFGELKTKHQALSIDLALRKTKDLTNQFQKLAKQIDLEKDVFRQHQADITKLEARLEEIKKDNLNEEKEVGSRQRELNILVGQIRNLENDKSLKEQETNFLGQNVKKLEEQVASRTADVQKFEERLTLKSEQLKRMAGEAEGLQKELIVALNKKKESEAKFNAAGDTRQEVTSAQSKFEAEYIDLEKQLASQTARITEMEGQLASVEKESREMTEDLLERQSDHKALVQQQAQLEQELEVMTQSEAQRAALAVDLAAQKEAMLGDLAKLQRKIDSKVNARDLLRDMIEKLEGYPESIKYLSKSKKWVAAAPLLSDLIYCEPEYRARIEFVLEAHLNDFVVENAEQATSAVELLTTAQKGRARFFILDQVRAPQQSIPEIPGATRLVDFIQFEEKYRALIEQLLGHAYVTNESPLTESFHGPRAAGLTFIDRSGAVIAGQSTIAGGSTGLFEGKKLGRGKHLEKLNEEIDKLTKEGAELKEQLDALELELQLVKNNDGKVEIDVLKARINECANELAKVGVHLDQYEQRQKVLADNAHFYGQSIDRLKSEKAITENQVQQIRLNLQQEASKWESADSAYTALMSDFSASNAEYNQANLAYIQAKNQLESTEQELRFNGKRRDELLQGIARDKEQIDADLHKIGQIDGELKEIANLLIDLYGKKKVQESALSGAEQAYFGARNEIEEIEQKLRNKNRESQNSQYLVNQMKEDHGDIRFRLATVNERLSIEFNSNLEEVGDREVDEDVPIDELEEKVVKMRNRLENFGEINPMAVEAYDEMKERYDTINDQKLDILGAKESLLETIKEIEDTATEKFNAAFGQIRGYFIEVFRSLFTEEDTCDLILEEPDKPLESQIRILAKPKGKRPRSLSQLSGGEKTLTATALLFALYLLKPAPFCVFDEVDAPLDDANIQKFNKIIKKFSKDSQFVIVTHNKQTMEAVDVIYGVYMEEQGVSGLTPVDFRYLDEVEMAATA